MQPTQTGIATALAVCVVILFFLFGGLSLFAPSAASPAAPIDFDATNPDTASPMSNDSLNNATELQMADVTPGTGATAEQGDTVTVQYVGALTDGTVFDASSNRGSEGFTFTLGSGMVIRGWDEGIVGMREGGVRRLVIPAALAYGAQGYSGVIPPNATLLFEVQLVSVQKATR